MNPRLKKMSKRSKRGMKTRNSKRRRRKVKRRKKKKTIDWVLYPLSNISPLVYLNNFISLY